MDTDAALKEILELVDSNNEEDLDSDDVDRLCLLIAGLHEHLSKDGMMPRAWLG